LQSGITHAFIVELASEADRAYYLDSDPAHAALRRLAKDSIVMVRVIDFTPGVFE
jgi:Stress responsive A/B Barrel Domain